MKKQNQKMNNYYQRSMMCCVAVMGFIDLAYI